MMLKIVAIRDSGVDTFMGVQCVQHVGVAIRGFSDEVNNRSSTSDLAKHPEDFELFQIGEFESSTGEISGCRPLSLARGVDVLKKDN